LRSVNVALGASTQWVSAISILCFADTNLLV
jgi:hypothetical protein